MLDNIFAFGAGGNSMFRVTLYSDIKSVNMSNGIWEFERPSRDWDFVA
jgi:hypothetical protein